MKHATSLLSLLAIALSAPSAHAANLVEGPAAPPAQPAQPAAQPAAAQPAQPAAQPVAAQPAQPAAQPVAAQPAQPAAQPATEPDPWATQPADATAQPAPADGTQPADATAGAPADSNEESEEPWIRRYAPERNTWELGIYGGLLIPSPNHEFYEVGPDNPMPVHLPYATVAPDFGARVGYYPLRVLGIEMGGGVMPTRTVGGNAAGLMVDEASATLYTFRAWGLLQAPFRVAPFVRAGFGLIGTSSTALGSDIDPAFHFGGGVKFYVNRWFGLRLDVVDNVATRVGISEGRAHNVEVLLGLVFRLGGKKKVECRDSDSDGLCDEGQEGVPPSEVDRCTYEWGPRENYGCPYRDTDLDGLYDPEQPGLDQDQIDGCWQVPGPRSNKGCPVDPDRDRLFSQNPPDVPPLPPDIIIDNCDFIPGPLSNQGCPENPDGDKNYSQNPAGVPPLPPEYIPDSCPVVPGPPEYRGCPADPDKDTCPTPNPSDIPPLPPEYTPDMCPDEPGPVNNYGCPATQNAKVALKNITFANNRWDILAPGKAELDQVADVLAQFPDVRLEISGHTSAPGSAKHNKKLSERRSKAVKKYLVGKGIAPSRLEVSWHGEEMLLPGIDPKDEKNRRIEFHLLAGNPEAIKILNNG